ncbi:MAG: hypothetical protein PHE29_04690 [Tissierellia bacterium]|nr:hypothetical protein [Tissierellia bacterium]
MKKIINAFKDFIYNITDYGLIITVVIVMMALLAWRFDILFNRSIVKEAIAITPPEYEFNETIPDKANNDDPGQISNSDDDENSSSEHNNNNETSVIATVEIPQGSFPSKIGDILMNSNIIEDKIAFLDRSVELGLDTKLRSGTYEIAIGTNLDEVIKIIANAN